MRRLALIPFLAIVAWVAGAQAAPGPKLLLHPLPHKIVTGAPYSATAVTIFRQNLADGNRIVQRHRFLVARDREGRTRKQLSLGPMGRWAAAPVLIVDPVGHTSYLLQPRSKTAIRMPYPAAPAPVAHAPLPPSPPGGHAFSGDDFFYWRSRAARRGSVVSLGERRFDGIEARGKKITRVIPAGRIGNRLPIAVTDVTWYAPALHAVVLSIHRDPRTGTHIYRLENIKTTDPNPSLFQVPKGYTLAKPKHRFFFHFRNR